MMVMAEPVTAHLNLVIIMEEVKQAPKEEEKKLIHKKSPHAKDAMELHIAQFAVTLYNMTKAYKSAKHLEIGSTTGIGTLLLSALYWDPDNEGHLVVCTDPYPFHLDRMARRFKDSGFMTNKENSFFQCHEPIEDEELDFPSEEKGVHVKGYVASYTKQPFEAGTFNSLTTNLNPADFKEAHRLLAEGGIAGFTFLAEKEKSTLITLAEAAFTNAKLVFPPIDTAPGGVEKMCEYVKGAGFSKARGWTQTSVFVVESGHELADILLSNPRLGLKESEEVAAHDAIVQKYEEEYAGGKKQVTLEAMFLIAYK